jgi:hypothetical protein
MELHMANKETQDMTGTGMYIDLPDPKPLDIDDPEPERYSDWMLWKLRQERKNRDKNVTK